MTRLGKEKVKKHGFIDKRTVIITQADGTYRLQNDEMSEFELLGMLECVVFDIKSARRREALDERKETVPAQEKARGKALKNPEVEIVQESNSAELRTRIGNAVKAIKNLGGDAADSDLSALTDDELQAELEELTSQYKRLKKLQSSD